MTEAQRLAKREIKFRAWDGKEMWTGFDIMPAGIIVPPAYKKYKGQLEYMQYTGLKDKNGKETYEGDIVKRTDSTGTVQIKVVRYDQKYCSFDLYNYSKEFAWKVIGNIYENPELL